MKNNKSSKKKNQKKSSAVKPILTQEEEKQEPIRIHLSNEAQLKYLDLLMPALEFQQRKHENKLREQIEEIEVMRKYQQAEKEKVLKMLENLQSLVVAQEKEYRTKLDNLQEMKEERERHLLLVQREEQQKMSVLEEKFSTVNLQLQLLQLEKQVEKSQHLNRRLEEKQRYPKKEDAQFDEKVRDGEEDSRLVCIICLENRRACVIQPCKHLSLCIACSSIELEDCPECRTKITCIERLYF